MTYCISQNCNFLCISINTLILIERERERERERRQTFVEIEKEVGEREGRERDFCAKAREN
jgi:hypothetical protein